MELKIVEQNDITQLTYKIPSTYQQLHDLLGWYSNKIFKRGKASLNNVHIFLT